MQGYWTEHSERAVILTGLLDKDILGRWKPDGSDTSARSCHYKVLDEREIASGLKDWLVGKDKLGF